MSLDYLPFLGRPIPPFRWSKLARNLFSRHSVLNCLCCLQISSRKRNPESLPPIKPPAGYGVSTAYSRSSPVRRVLTVGIPRPTLLATSGLSLSRRSLLDSIRLSPARIPQPTLLATAGLSRLRRTENRRVSPSSPCLALGTMRASTGLPVLPPSVSNVDTVKVSISLNTGYISKPYQAFSWYI